MLGIGKGLGVMGESMKKAQVALLTVPAILASGMVAAQSNTVLPPLVIEGQATPKSSEDDILVKATTSATKTATPVIETPQAVSTVTRKQLDDQNPLTVRDALNYTSGVLSGIDATSRYDSVFMRGFGGFGLSTNAVNFLDGVKLPRGQAFAIPSVDPFLIDRIDVLKGPSALLYGQTSPGGMINQVSRAPDAEPYNEARLEGGSFDRLQGGITSRGKIDEAGLWHYGVSAVGRTAGTRYKDVDEERVGFAPSIAWTPSEDTRLVLRGFYQNDPEGGYFNSLYPSELAPAAYRRYLNRDLNIGDPSFDSYEREQYGAGYSFEHRFNDWLRFGSTLRYSTIDLDFKSLQMAAPITAGGLIARNAVHSIEDVQGTSFDNHAQFNFATGGIKHEALAGIDFQHSQSDWTYLFGAATPLDVTNPVYGTPVGPLATFIDNRQTLQQTGLYLQDQISLGNLRVLLGSRYDWTKQETENRLASSTSTQKSGAASYRAGLTYLFDSGFAPYVSYSTSFDPTVGVDATGRAFDPTEARQWEAGLKYQPGFMDALFTLSAFHIRQENVLSPGAVPGFSVQQGEVRSRGIEFEARGKLIDNLDVIGAFTLLDTEVTESTVATTVGKRPQAAPKYYGSLWASYGFDTGFLDGLTLGSGVRFVGGRFADDANTIKTSGYTLVDMAVRYDLGKLSTSMNGAEATLNVSNLLDTEYYASCSSTFYCQHGNGAQVLAGMRYRW